MIYATFKSATFVPHGGAARLTARRLRRPTQLPGLSPTWAFASYLDRLRWLFSGTRR